jgi:hypothetical protein
MPHFFVVNKLNEWPEARVCKLPGSKECKKRTKFQNPTSREDPNSKLQRFFGIIGTNRVTGVTLFVAFRNPGPLRLRGTLWDLESWGFSEAWLLEFGASKKTAPQP